MRQAARMKKRGEELEVIEVADLETGGREHQPHATPGLTSGPCPPLRPPTRPHGRSVSPFRTSGATMATARQDSYTRSARDDLELATCQVAFSQGPGTPV